MRRFVIILAGLAAVLTMLVALLPWWLGTALAVIGPQFGLNFGRYVREGYGRFALESVDVRRRTVDVRIARIEAETPVVWLWKRWTGPSPWVTAGAWRVDVQPHPINTPGRLHGWLPLQARLEHIASELARWLPRAQVGAGVVTWREGELAFASASWSNRTLVTPELTYRKLKVAATLTVPGNAGMRLTATLLGGEAALALTAHGSAVTGSAMWAGQPAEIVAHFPDEGWRPIDATLRADGWKVPGARAGVGPKYAMLRGGGLIEWKNNALTGEASADGEPAPHAHAPPLSVQARARADQAGLVVETLKVTLPGLSAQLGEPVRIDREGRLRSTAATFTMVANLAHQPWIAARGKIYGEGKIAAGNLQRAAIEFTAAADDLEIEGETMAHASVTGRFEWPRLQIMRLELATADGSRLNGSGGWDFRQRAVLEAKVSGEVTHQLAARWRLKLPAFGRASFDAQAAGPLHELAHEGRITVADLQWGKMKPLAVNISWRGRGGSVEECTAEGETGTTTITATGAGDLAHIRVATAALKKDGAVKLKLVRPVEIEIEGKGSGEKYWRTRALRLEGENAAVDASIAWGPSGSLDLAGRNIPSDWLRDLFALPATKWTVRDCDMRGKWQDGPASYSVKGAVSVELGQERRATASVQVRGGRDGVQITALNVAEGSGVILKAAGRLPLTVWPGRQDFVRIDPNAAFALRAETAANPAFWAKFADLSGVELVGPRLTVAMDGTWSHPRGTAEMRATRVEARPGRFKFPWPKIEALAVQFAGDRDGLRIEHGEATIDGQTLRADGWLPLAQANWRDLAHQPREFFRRGELHVALPDADMAAVARYFPAYLAPAGRLQADATLKPDFHLAGYVRLRHAVSRPLGPLGILQDIDAEVRLDDGTVNLESVTAQMGGQRVTLRGRAELQEHGAPRLNLTLTGDNLPFVRRSGLLLRGDLDLKLTTPATGGPTLAGTVRLRDSLFLSDVRSLIPSGTKTPESRPPYFAIKTAPMDRWGIDVDVRGERFLRLETAVFNGTASARFHLSGTLGEPHATGVATTSGGTVKLPFASFDVKQGEVTLTPDRPYEPQILLTGTTRHYGYDLQMELAGPAAAPNLTFTSSPPLTAEQLVLMVMAGQAPQNEIGTTDKQRAARFGAYFGATLLGGFGGGGGADRLTLTSGEDISEQGHETYSIEYRLNDRWSLTGEYDQFDDYNAGLKWRVYTKGGKKADDGN